MLQEYFSALIQVVAGFGFAGMIIILSMVFGRRVRARAAAQIPYECGVLPEGAGSPAYFSIKFYLVAILFLIFDLEVVFLYPWAVEFKSVVMHNPDAFITMMIFLGVLFVAYLYAVAKGVINWHRNPSPRQY